MTDPQLEELRRLLLEPEQQRLEKLESQPLQQALRDTIRRDAAGLAEVLFPIMGPSIRRAIAEALRDFITNINGAVGEAFSWQGVKWRMEALRTGQPYGEVVLRHRLSCRVEQALLIQKDSGLVISKAELSAVVANDSDAFSAMLSAIQDFVSDSLEGDSALSTIDMGERTIWIIRGPHAHLACVISGVPPSGLRAHFADVLDDIHNLFGDELSIFAGDADSLAGINTHTARCLDAPRAGATAPPARARWPAPLLALLLLAVVAYVAWRPTPADPAQALRASLNATAGVSVQELSRTPSGWYLHLLHDPLIVLSPAESSAAPHVDIPQTLAGKPLVLHTTPFVSLAPELILRRARQMLAIPATVTADLDGDILHLRGAADSRTIAGWNNATLLPPGVASLRTADLRPLRDPARAAAWASIESLAQRINTLTVDFADRDAPLNPDAADVAEARDALHALDTALHGYGGRARLMITGNSDGVGRVADNEDLRLRRAARVDQAINGASMLAVSVLRRAATDHDRSREPDMSLRHVQFRVQLLPPAGEPS
ncbi:MAG: hypothetical protein ABF296_01055 [Oceanococcaceae bacterium]